MGKEKKFNIENILSAASISLGMEIFNGEIDPVYGFLNILLFSLYGMLHQLILWIFSCFFFHLEMITQKS